MQIIITVYFQYFLILYLNKGSLQKLFFLGLCPKLWVGGGQESYSFGHFEYYFPP